MKFFKSSKSRVHLPKILYSVHQFLKVAIATKNCLKGFAKVLSGGRVIRLDVHKPFTEALSDWEAKTSPILAKQTIIKQYCNQFRQILRRVWQ